MGQFRKREYREVQVVEETRDTIPRISARKQKLHPEILEPKQLYEYEPEKTQEKDTQTYIYPNGNSETLRTDSRTYINHNGYRRYSDSDRLVHIHNAEVYVV